MLKLFGSKVKVCYDYYNELLTDDKTTSTDVGNFLDGLRILDSDDAQSCECPITEDECTLAIRGMLNNKSPGIDGLPVELYKKYFNVFGELYVESVNHTFQHGGQLSANMKEGIISLINKTDYDLDKLENWRPITLLNVDYKIISKVIATRLKKVLEKIIGPYQTSTLPKRSVTQNLRLLRNTIEYCKEKNSTSFLFIMDQSKAFDRVNHSFMFKLIGKLGFGPDFQRWIKLLYAKNTSRVLVNKMFTDIINVTRSLQQGSGLSPSMYCVCIEVLLYKIYSSVLVKGIAIPYTTITVKLFANADDTTVITSDVETISIR